MTLIDPLRQRYRRLRLQTRFALHAILLVAVLFALVLPVVLAIQEAAILGTARDNGLRLVTIFAFSSVQAVIADDFLGLRQVVNSLGRERNVRYAMILDLSGRVLIHSRVNETGVTYDDPLTRRALAAAAPLFHETRSRQGDLKYLWKKTIGDLLPHRLLNAPKRGFVIPITKWLRGPLKPRSTSRQSRTTV